MKAVVAEKYGPPESLELVDLDRPMPGPEQVLVKVKAASINPADLHSFTGGLVVRLSNGIRRPKRPVTGIDVAGVAETVGENVTDIHPGDEVFGTAPGSLAEYASGRYLVAKPASITFAEAAAIPIAGLTALQALRDKAGVQPGQSVLINGAAGGVGTFAVQIAKAFGAVVTGVCSAANIDLVRSLGADHVIDYTKEDFARSGRTYDLVIDVVGNRSMRDLRRVLAPSGTLVPIGGGHDRGHGGRSMLKPIGLMAKAVVLSRFVKQNMKPFIAQVSKEDLTYLATLIEQGKVKPVVDRSYPLVEASQAFAYLRSGHAPGKIAINLNGHSDSVTGRA